MEVITLFFLTQTIFAILGSILFLVLIIGIILIIKKVNDVARDISKMTEEGREAAAEAKKFVNKIGKSLFEYTMLKVANKIIKPKKRGERG